MNKVKALVVSALLVVTPYLGVVSQKTVNLGVGFVPLVLFQLWNKDLSQVNFAPRNTGQEILDPSIPATLGTIGDCESGIRLADGTAIPNSRRQFNTDGSVVRGVVNPKDVGMFQINEFYHLTNAQSLGIDIYTEAGNTAYAHYLYDTQGTTPWNWSRDCWDK